MRTTEIGDLLIDVVATIVLQVTASGFAFKRLNDWIVAVGRFPLRSQIC